MSDKFVFQNAKVKHMELKLLSAQSINRLLECTTPNDAFKCILDFGFGAGVNFEGNDFDKLFQVEEQKLVDFLKEFNVDNALNVFLIQNDYLNLKTLLKAKVLENKEPVLAPCGIYDIETLENFINVMKKEDCNPYMYEAIEKVVDLLGSGKLTPHIIDTTVDKAMYKNIFAISNKSGSLCKKYFIKKIDYLNLCSYLRVKKLNLSIEFFKDSFIEGGSLDISFFEKIYDGSLDLLRESIKHTDYEDLVNKAIDEGSIVAFEVGMDNALLLMWKQEKNELFSVSPIVAYYLTRSTELKTIKLIVAGIKNHVDAKLIKERMRELYA